MNIYCQYILNLFSNDYRELARIKDQLTRELSATLVLSDGFITHDDQGNDIVFKAVEDDESVIRPAKFTQNEDGSSRKELLLSLSDLMWLAGEMTENVPHDWNKL